MAGEQADANAAPVRLGGERAVPDTVQAGAQVVERGGVRRPLGRRARRARCARSSARALRAWRRRRPRWSGRRWCRAGRDSRASTSRWSASCACLIRAGFVAAPRTRYTRTYIALRAAMSLIWCVRSGGVGGDHPWYTRRLRGTLRDRARPTLVRRQGVRGARAVGARRITADRRSGRERSAISRRLGWPRGRQCVRPKWSLSSYYDHLPRCRSCDDGEQCGHVRDGREAGGADIQPGVG